MIGPVLYQELLLGSRRGRFLSLRRIYTGWLILQFSYFFVGYLFEVWRSVLPPPEGLGRVDILASSRFAESYLSTFVVQQFALLFLLTPAFVAGAVTDEKSRGTLQHLLTTDLTTWQIVLGKFLGRMTQLAVLALAGLPLLCLMAPFAGFNLIGIVALCIVSLLPMFAVGAASMLASVWARQTRDAVIGVYAAGGMLFLAGLGVRALATYLASLTLPSTTFLASVVSEVDDVIRYLNPLFVIRPVWSARQDLGLLGQRLAVAFALWTGFGMVCLALAVWRLRKAYIRQLESAGVTKRLLRRWGRRYADQEEPIRWREAQVEGIAPLPILRRIPRPVGLVLTVLVTFLISYQEAFEVQAVWFVLIASAVVGIRCSGTVSGERERQTWEALLLTPLPVRDLIREKLSGILRAARPYVIVYSVAVILALIWSIIWPYVYVGVMRPVGRRSFPGGAAGADLGWTLLSLLAVWPAMYFVGAVGVYYSVSSRSSWKSLLATLGVGYVGGLMICAMSAPLVGCGAAIVVGFLAVLGIVPRGEGFIIAGILIGIVAGWWIILRKLGGQFLLNAQKAVVGRERTPYWKTGVNCGWAVEQYMNRWENKHA